MLRFMFYKDENYFFCGGYCSNILDTNSLIFSSFFSVSLVRTPSPSPCQISSFFLASMMSMYNVPSVYLETLVLPPHK